MMLSRHIAGANAVRRPTRPRAVFTLTRHVRPTRLSRPMTTTVRAMGEQGSSFDVNMYYEASISEVRSADREGHVILLQLNDGLNSLLRVFVGEFECEALVKKINSKATSMQDRPGTHDLMKNMLEALGYRVTKVRIAALVGNTYHARVHFGRGRGIKLADGAPSATEIDIDARPSDALNLAVRFKAPIYVNKEVANKMSLPPLVYDERTVSAAAAAGAHATDSQTAAEIAASCREEISQHADPTIMNKLALEVAIKEERFEEASRLRDAIEKTLASDRPLGLVVAMESALEDGRYEEAARLRDELRRLRLEAHRNGSRVASDVLDV